MGVTRSLMASTFIQFVVNGLLPYYKLNLWWFLGLFNPYINSRLFKVLHKTENLLIFNSTYNEVAFNEKLAITKENLCTKYFPFTYNDVALSESRL